MKLFISKVFLIFTIYLIISWVITFVTPYHWGNPWYSTKIQFLEGENKEGGDVFFFGSSRVYRQIDPNLFDELINEVSSNEIKSFNLGAPATFNPQSYFLYENFLESELSKNAKFCFLELDNVDLLSDYFLHEERVTYWQNFSDIIFVMKSHYYNGGLNSDKKVKSILNYSISYLEGMLHFGHFGQQIINLNYYDNSYIGSRSNGFLPLEDHLKLTNDTKVKSNLLERQQNILDNPKLLTVMKNKNLAAYNDTIGQYDIVNLDKIMKLIELSDNKGIELIFILSPRNAQPELIRLSQQIPQKNFIDICNPISFGVLYELENSFDVGHLNSKGAKVYTKLLFESFKDNFKRDLE